MKILYCIRSNNSFMGKWQDVHFIDELSRNGIYIEKFDFNIYENVDMANEKLLSYVKGNELDLFMTYFNEKDLFIESLQQIKKKGIPTLLICYDNLLIPYFHKNIAKYFNLVWLTSFETKHLFDKWSANSMVMPYAANPFVFVPTKTNSMRNRIVFIGSPYGSRVAALNKLAQYSNKLDVYYSERSKNNAISKSHFDSLLSSIVNNLRFPEGRSVMEGYVLSKLYNTKLDISFISMKGGVPFTEISKLYSSYSLSFSSTSARNTDILKNNVPVINLRSFEISMSGGIQICRYNNELSGYYKNKEELLFYHDDEELIDLLKYYLDERHATVISQMKRKARLRSENEHTWMCRFDKIFSVIGIKNK